ncbi:MAG TPA: alpha/beta hydrolase [Bdellovibrionales bacterium]|nr:alpha/beta hydrolase [Bdellovibrionales bacterium]
MTGAEPTTWIFLRGLAREAGHWGGFVEQFARAFPNDEMLPIDLPGTGEFRDQMSPRSIQEIFTFVRAAAVQRARSQGQFKLVAVSLGGMVAQQWLQARPEDLSGCVLINSSARSLSPAIQRLRWQVWPKLLKIVANQVVREREKSVIDILINDPDARERALPLWIKLGNEHPVSYLTFASQLWAASRFKGLGAPTKVPVLLLAGMGDRFVDPSCSMALASTWNWPLVKHPWGGHDLTWDDPDWVLVRIREWVNRRSTSATL